MNARELKEFLKDKADDLEVVFSVTLNLAQKEKKEEESQEESSSCEQDPMTEAKEAEVQATIE